MDVFFRRGVEEYKARHIASSIVDLPEPVFPPGNRGGKVVVRVTVDKSGRVTAATFEPKGSTTSASELVEAAVSAARKAQFTESRAYIQGGTITYIFKLK